MSNESRDGGPEAGVGGARGGRAVVGVPFPRGEDNPAVKAKRERERMRELSRYEVPEPAEEVGDGAPEVLRAMRWAWRNVGAECPATPQQELFRVQARKDPAKFAADLLKAEREWRAGGGGVGSNSSGGTPRDSTRGTGGAVDEGTERAVAVLEELFGRLGV